MTSEPILYPPPWRGVKRAAKGIVGLLVVVGVAWLLWFSYARHVYNASNEELRAKGQPVTPEDLDARLPVVAPADNAALHYERARTLLSWPPDVTDWVQDLSFSEPWTDADFAMAAKCVESSRAALEEMRAGTQCKGVRWTILPSVQLQHRAMGLGHAFPYTDYMRLARALRFAAIQAHHQGDETGMLEDLIDAKHLGDALGERPEIYGILEESAIDALMPQVLAEFGPLQFGDGPGHAPRAEVVRAIHELLDMADLKAQRVRDLRGERIFIEAYLQESPEFSFRRLLPSWNLDIPRLRRDFACLEAASSEDSFDAAKKLYPVWSDPYDMSIAERIARTTSTTDVIDIRYLLLVNRMIADRRLAAVALAAELWMADHPGQRLASLAPLVPNYLDAIPADPFDPALLPLRFCTQVPARVYSVNEDGVDDGGSLMEYTDTSLMRRQPLRSLRTRFLGVDFVFFIEPWTKP